METTTAPSIDVDQLLTEAKALIEDGKNFLLSQGKVLELSEWITISEYAKKHSISTQVISQWIIRGVIPEDSYVDIPEIGKKLVRDIIYKD